MSEFKYYHENFNFLKPYQSSFFESCVKFNIKSTKARLFEVLSDTSNINKRLNLPPRYSSEINGELVIDTKILGISSSWVEKPWRWKFGENILVERFFTKGPLFYESAVFRIIEKSDENYEVQFYYRAHFKYRLLKFIYGLVFPSFGKKMGQVVQDLCDMTDNKKKSNIGLYNLILTELKTTEIPNRHKEIIAQIIANFDDDELYKIQIPLISERFNEPSSELLSSFLIATKEGLFDINWDVICPHCKGKRSRVNSLNDLLEEDECEPCKLKFKVDTINKIDVNFSVNSKYRSVQEISFCAAEPAKKPHIIFNDILSKGESISLSPTLLKEHYRVRSIGLEEENIFEVKDNPNDAVVSLSLNKLHAISKDSKIIINNTTDKSQNVIFESIEEPKYSLSPLNVFNNKIFQTLFNDQKLNQGVQLKLPEQIILFSDVVDSTNFYKKSGDVKAYKQIQQHFKIMDTVIEKHNGIIIKTIGDAVMASFKSVKDALNAAKQVIKDIDEDDICHLKIRFSLHKGPVIAVNHNKGIDYFGNTVNRSAKLQAISNADEISLSEELFIEYSELFKNAEQRIYLDNEKGYVFSL